ncbi:ArsR family transcriptional regulator [Streptomyces piniterrae]|uniref:ArsR family transcriptional regulator n=1 Tax=Streptomyces piniterrae TaxID=2571125 RepID=A0A4U0NJ92_9ACTN|nr:ArsR family transcriptional regulator [Streptomyces piniterrae]TJZ54346.1 ArsR family transcriptional regulator [Streptomyces piniterrae]
MLRIIFTAEDLSRIRVAAGPDHMWEITNSVQTLQRRDGTTAFGAWRQSVRPRLSADSRILADLLPPYGYSPDFLTPAPGTGGLTTAVRAVTGTPSHRLDTDLTRLAAGRRLSGWVGRLAQGRHSATDALGRAIHAFHTEALAPYWPRIRAHVEADCLIRRHAIREGGPEALLAGLGPRMRWVPPVLEVDYPVCQTLHLRGRGLTLQPSYFCWPAPVSLFDEALAPVLVYPVPHDLWARPDARHDPVQVLGALMGPVRAAVLVAACTARSTGDLAGSLSVSTSSVSQHTAKLRDAGLLITVRQSGRALHITTSLGHALIRGAQRGSLQ